LPGRGVLRKPKI